MIYSENILICIAVPLAVTALFVKGNARRFILSFIVGMGVCLLSAYIGGFIRYMSHMNAPDTSVFISPSIEEIMKMVSILLFMYMFNPVEDELILVSTGIGAGFATFENSCYILSSGASSLSYTLIRGAAVGVMHLVTVISIAMAINVARRYKILSFSGILGALSLAVTVHSLYNLLVSKEGVSSYIGYGIPLVCAILLYFLSNLYGRGKAENRG
ncbi:MAG: PrsW family intramembrane metalloprotease [Lachnospiraceae bacterium]|nr:PrsW family intramembrane metalloprotease [Lachnospiraceae bacterium]MBR5944974.1 PrsW family intramembrane metalloprotease [Lachnospiraceae bacterium]